MELNKSTTESSSHRAHEGDARLVRRLCEVVTADEVLAAP